MKKRISIQGAVLVCALAVAIGLFLCSGPAGAATHWVTDPQDWDDGACTAGDCTLREAIKYATSGDTVTFNDNDTYVLTLGEITIDKNLIIDGLDGATHGNTVISGNNASRVFKIIAGTVTIKDLTITNGYTNVSPGGGGIMNAGILTLDNVVVSNCVVDGYPGGGVWSGETTLNITDSLITGNSAQGDTQYEVHGGGIYSEGDVGSAVLNMTETVVSLNQAVELGGGVCAKWTDAAINRCTFDQNQSSTGSSFYGGGGMYAHESEVDVIDCAFNQNTAAWGGGGIAAEHSSPLAVNGSTFYHNSAGFAGGGIFFVQGIFKATNSTFSDNLADSSGGGLALLDLDGTVGMNLLSFVTITNNTADADCDGGGTCDDGAGGGLYFENPGLLELKGVIVAGNSDRSVTLKFADIYHASGTLQSNGYNLIGDNTSAGTAFPAGLPNGNNDYVGTSASPLTGVVQGIADNGGLTWTCALPAGSLAINHGPPDCADGGGSAVTTDQRGLGRNRGGCPDIGAYEVPAGSGAPLAMLLE